MLELPGRHQQLLACILSQYLNSPRPVPGPKQRVRVPKKKAPRSKNIQPNVSAYNNGVSPHPMEARSTKQAHGSKKQKPSSKTINLAVEKKFPWVQHKYMQVQKKYPHRVQKTHKQVPHIFCDPRSKKNSGQVQKTCTGPKKRVPRSKKHASPYFLTKNVDLSENDRDRPWQAVTARDSPWQPLQNQISMDRQKTHGFEILGIALNLIPNFIGKTRVPLSMGIWCTYHPLTPK